MIPPHKQTVIDQITAILNGEIDPIHGRAIIAEDVILHMDGMIGHGFAMWYSWITFIKLKGRVPDLGIDHRETRLHEDGTISIHGAWTGTLNGTYQQSNDSTVRYRIEGGLIREIWTHRTNYIFPMGVLMRSSLTWWLVGLYYSIWKRLPAQRYLNVADAPSQRESAPS